MKTYNNLRKLNDKQVAVDVTTKGWFGKSKTKTIIIGFSDWYGTWYDIVRHCVVDEELATWIYLNMDKAGIKFKEE